MILTFRLSIPFDLYLGMPGLRVFCPFTGLTAGGSAAADYSGLNHNLSKFGNPQYKMVNDLVMYSDLDGSGDYFSIADHADLDLTGGELWMDPDLRGITIGGYFRFDSALPGTGIFPVLWGKHNDSGVDYRSYWLGYNGTAGTFQFNVSLSGTSGSTVNVQSTETPALNTWYFISGQFDPGASMRIQVNELEDINTTSIPATAYSGAGDVLAGVRNGGGPDYHNGGIALLFIAGSLISDDAIGDLFEETRDLFEV